MTNAPKRSLNLPVVGDAPAAAPTAMACLQCQITGRRRLLCSRAEECRNLPIVFAVGPLLLALWAGTAIAFYLTVR